MKSAMFATTPFLGDKSLAALSKLTIAALIGFVLLFSYAMAFIFGFEMFGLVVIGIPLLFAAAIMIGWRWTPLLAVVWFGLMISMNSQGILYDLAHPEFFKNFTWEIIMDATLICGIVGGIGATVQNYRTPADNRPTPRWLPYGLTALIALGTGAILVATLVQSGTGTGISPEILAQLPALSAKGVAFDRSEIQARVGETVALRLVNDDTTAHSFDIDEFNVHVPMVSGQPGLALFTPTQPGTYTFYCNIPAHREAGMVGTLVVAP